MSIVKTVANQKISIGTAEIMVYARTKSSRIP